MGDKIVAALAKTVLLYSYHEITAFNVMEMRKMASYRPAAYPVDLAVEGNIIAVADLMKSMTLVEYVPPADGERAKLVEIARDYQAFWTTAVS
ncbi:hypothetical protein PC116_g32209, partial [Phytophthora cactorum]